MRPPKAQRHPLERSGKRTDKRAAFASSAFLTGERWEPAATPGAHPPKGQAVPVQPTVPSISQVKRTAGAYFNHLV
jgi:hypothetical protein